MVSCILFFLITVLYFHPVLSSKLIFIERDLSVFFIPPKYLWVGLVKSFVLPLWNPYNYSGIPLLATLQPGICYPPHILYLFMPFNVVWNWLIIMHFVFSGISLYLFLRYLKASAEASFVGGVTFMLSGYLLSVHNLLPHLFSVSWFPLIIMFFLKYFHTKRIKYIILSSIFLTMQFLAGAPEIVIMTVVILIFLTCFTGIFINREVDYIFKLKAILFLLLFFVLFSAIQLFPFYELKSQSIRSSGLNYKEATIWSFQWVDIIQFFLPDIFGAFKSDTKYWSHQTWLKTIYLGIMPFFLSVFYFITKDRKRWIFLVLMLVSFLFALGGNTPVYKVLYNIPPFNGIRYPVKFLFLFFFVISVTAGLGLDRLIKGIEEKNPHTERAIYAAFYSGFLFAIAWGYVVIFKDDLYSFFERIGIKPDVYNEIDYNIHNIRRFLFFSFLFCVMLLVTLRIKYKRIAIYIVMFLLALDLFLANYGFFQYVSWNQYIQKHPFADSLLQNGGTQRYSMSPKTDKQFRVFPADRMALSPAYASLFRVYSVDGAEVLRVKHYDEFFNIMQGSASLEQAKRFFNISGVRYLITSYEIIDKDMKFLKEVPINDNKAYLYEYKASPERLMFFRDVIYAKDEAEVKKKLLDKKINLKKTLILLSGERDESIVDGPLKGKADLLSYKANNFVVKSRLEDDSFLYINDTHYPGWKAYIDGIETRIFKANLAFRAIKVPKGDHTIVFKYVPIFFYLGMILTIVGIILAIYMIKKERQI